MVEFKTAVEQETRRLEVIHPTPEDIPGCMTLLDDFLSCNVIGSQLKSFYRHGAQADCARKRADLSFCLTLRKLEPDARRAAWIAHRAEWWAGRRTGRSSEDVWNVRAEPLPDFPPARSAQSADAAREFA